MRSPEADAHREALEEVIVQLETANAFRPGNRVRIATRTLTNPQSGRHVHATATITTTQVFDRSVRIMKD